VVLHGEGDSGQRRYLSVFDPFVDAARLLSRDLGGDADECPKLLLEFLRFGQGLLGHVARRSFPGENVGSDLVAGGQRGAHGRPSAAA
jgi:hypothetical protein